MIVFTIVSSYNLIGSTSLLIVMLTVMIVIRVDDHLGNYVLLAFPGVTHQARLGQGKYLGKVTAV
jgi:hypothetical protein